MKTKIQAKPQTLRGDDGHDTFSIRIKHSLTVKLNEMARETTGMTRFRSGLSILLPSSWMKRPMRLDALEIMSSAGSWRMVWRTR